MLWLSLFFPSGAISPLLSSSILDTYRPGEFILQCPIFLPVHTILNTQSVTEAQRKSVPWLGPQALRQNQIWKQDLPPWLQGPAFSVTLLSLPPHLTFHLPSVCRRVNRGMRMGREGRKKSRGNCPEHPLPSHQAHPSLIHSQGTPGHFPDCHPLASELFPMLQACKPSGHRALSWASGMQL